jgi:hypothetical protein
MTPYTIFVGTSGHGVYASTDGKKWTSGGPATVVALSSMPQPTVSYASLPDGSVQFTQNSGSTWAATTTAPGGTISSWIAVPGIGPLGATTNGAGAAEVLQGKNSGATWNASSPIGTGSATAIAFGGGASPAATAYVGVNGSGGGVFKSTDLGSASYSFAPTNFPETDVLSVATAASATSTVFAGTAGQGSGIYVSTDSGSSWTGAGAGLGNTTVNAIAIDPADAMNLYAGTGSGVYRSTDGGTMWTLSGLGSDAVTGLAILNGKPSTIYAVTANGLYVSTDSGN